MSYLVQSPFGVSEEGDAVSLSDADCHSSESGGWGVPRCFSFQRRPAGHWAGGVVRATGIRIKGILWYMNTAERLVRWFVLTWNTKHVEVFIDSLYLSKARVPKHFPLEGQTPNLGVDNGPKSSTHCIVLNSQDAKRDYMESLRGKWEITLFFCFFPCVYHLEHIKKYFARIKYLYFFFTCLSGLPYYLDSKFPYYLFTLDTLW